MHRVLQVAVVGTGRMGKIHIYNAATSLKTRLCGIFDIPEKLKQVDELAKVTGCQVYKRWKEEVLMNPEIDAVIIASPTSTHKELTCQALESGKAVLCEKPLGVDLKEIQFCHRKARELGLPLVVDWNRRHDSSFMKLVSQVRQGFVGQIQVIRVSGRDHPVPPLEFLRNSNSCIFRDMIVHDVDLVRWLMNMEPISVYATAACRLPQLVHSGVHDTATAVMEFANGVVALLDSARNATYGYDQRLEVFGDKGMLSVGNFPSNEVEWSNENGIRRDIYAWSFPERYEISFRHILEHFADVVLRNKSPYSVEWDDIGISRIVSAMRLSASLGKRIILDDMNKEDITLEQKI
eukprot:jgi/Galph1/3410/GphlegSOOS_G2093.1